MPPPGLGSLAHFSEDSGDSSNQEDEYESEAGDSEEGAATDEFIYLDEQLERPSHTHTQASRTLQVGFGFFFLLREKRKVKGKGNRICLTNNISFKMDANFVLI